MRIWVKFLGHRVVSRRDQSAGKIIAEIRDYIENISNEFSGTMSISEVVEAASVGRLHLAWLRRLTSGQSAHVDSCVGVAYINLVTCELNQALTDMVVVTKERLNHEFRTQLQQLQYRHLCEKKSLENKLCYELKLLSGSELHDDDLPTLLTSYS